MRTKSSPRSIFSLSSSREMVSTTAYLLRRFRSPESLTHESCPLAPAFPGGLQRRWQCLEVVGTVVADSVYEEGRRTPHTAPQAAPEILGNPARVRVLFRLPLETLSVEAHLSGVTLEVGVLQPPVRLEEAVVHLPEAALSCGGLRGLGRGLDVGVDAGKREGAEDETQAVAETPPQPPDDGVGPHRVGAVVVAELDEGYGGVLRSAHAVCLAYGRDQLDAFGASPSSSIFAPPSGTSGALCAVAIHPTFPAGTAHHPNWIGFVPTHGGASPATPQGRYS